MSLLNDADAIFLGDVAADAVYLGDTLVWSAVWTPKSVPGLTLWIDAQQQIGSDGVAVPLVIDWSKDNRTLVFQPGNGPIYRTNFGGRPCFEWMAGASYGLDCGLWNAGPAGLTFFFVGQITGGSYPMMVVWGTDGDGFEMRHGGSAQEIVLRYSSHGIVWSHSTPSGPNVDYLWALRVGTDTDAWTNADIKSDGRVPAMPNVDQTLYVARRELGYPFIGPMREVLVYAGPIADADVTAVATYLMNKWGLTL